MHSLKSRKTRVQSDDAPTRAAEDADASRINAWVIGEKLERAVRIVDRGQLAELSLITHRAAYPASGKGVNEKSRDTEFVELFHPARVSCSRSVRTVTLDRTLALRMSIEAWPGQLEVLQLSEPTAQNIGDWMKVIDSWFGSYASSLSKLRFAALEQLLLVESQVSRFVRDRMQPGDAPPPSRAPGKYTIRTPAMERRRQTQLSWWDRFQTADGTLPTIARLVAAAGIVGAVMFVGTTVGMLVANVPVVFAGKLAAERIPFKAIRIAAALLFAALGAWVLYAGIPAT